MRVRSPSTTLTLTSTVSPGWKSGISLPAESFATCSCSSVLIKFMGILRRQRPHWRAVLLACLDYGALYANAARLSPFCRLFVGAPCRIGLPEIGPARPRQGLGLCPPPGRYLGVIARQKDFRDRASLEAL